MVIVFTTLSGLRMKIHRLLTKSWPWIAGVGALAMAAQAMPGAEPAGTDACGLGLPPNAAGFAQQEEQRASEAKKNGFLHVCEANLQRYSVTFVPMAAATRGLDFDPVDLRSTPFAKLESLGGRSETVADAESRLYRGFRNPEGQALTLFEHDMSADGSNMWRDPKDEPERVNGLPARLIVLQASSGRAVSVLSWLQGRRYYEIWLEANAARNPMRARLFDLANSLPPSIPACPNEPPPKRAALGPDGFPVDEPMLRTLATEQIEALSRKRPCK
jgi:hypothetical protein